MGWPLSKVDACLNNRDKDALMKFIGQRYAERFVSAITTLRATPGSTSGYGFAIMALCSLLVESLQSYRYGLPPLILANSGGLLLLIHRLNMMCPCKTGKPAQRFL